MSTLNLTQLEAPVAYTDVRSQLNTMRGIFGLVLTILGVAGLLDGLEPAPWVLILGAYLVVDASWRRGRGTSAVPMLVTDIVVFGVLAIVRDDPGLIEAAAFFYVLTGALLLLRIPAAVAVVAVAIALGIPALLIRPISDPNVNALRQGIVDIVVIAAIAGLMATLLYGAVQALNASTLRHQTALDAERRAVELKDEFVSMVSHEFRTPLTSIAGFSETLRASWDELSQEEIEEFLIIMRQEAHHLSNLVEDILVIPRIEAGRLRLRPQEFDLAAEVAATSRLVFADTGREILTSIPGGVMVRADRGRVGQVLRNLMDNARKYGGDTVEIDGEAATDIYTISVSDNGPGIVESDWERVFEHFEQGTKGDARLDEGVGLGLPIARQLARAMGGDVWYVPRFPTGASFRFSMLLSRIIPETGTAAPAEEADTLSVLQTGTEGPEVNPSTEPSQ
ncbi:MAG: HAMP domain-containing sensor histidine kinase [Acidimicrobiia bacterium]|nr:HAMP domain-containing sensor histidine kinase [Acidimicrobiia bacterium]